MTTFVSPWVGFSTFADDGGGDGGTYEHWGSPSYPSYPPSNAAVQDGVDTIASGQAAGYSDWLNAAQLASSPGVPVGSTIHGIEIGVHGYAYATAGAPSLYAQILKGGVRVGNVVTGSIVVNTTGTYADNLIGGANVDFGAGVKVADLASSGFGISIQGRSGSQATDFHVDYLKVRFHYEQTGMILTL